MPLHILFLIIFTSFQIKAGTYEDTFFRFISDSYSKLISQKNTIQTSDVKSFLMKPKNNEQRKCQQFLAPLQTKNKISIGYYIGYSDSHRDTVTDIYERKAMMAFLLSPCTDNKVICGFLPAQGQNNVFFKNVNNLSGQSLQIEISLYDSSLTTSNKLNINNREQYVKSEVSRQSFIKALMEKDIIIYSGHSRYGGGPDFYPKPFAYDENEKLEAIYYKKQQRGYRDMILTLNERNKKGLYPPMMIMLNSCDSNLHFANILNNKNYSPTMTFLTKKEITIYDAIPQFLGLLRLILTQTCPESFESYFNTHSIYLK